MADRPPIRRDTPPPQRRGWVLVSGLIVTGWIVITAGIAFGYADPVENYQYLTLLVAIICARLLGPLVLKPR